MYTTYGTHVTWNSLARHLSIDHHKTVSEYTSILQDMHVLHIIEAIQEDKLKGAPLIEGICLDYLAREYPVYYIKGNSGVVGIAVIINKKMIPLEVKWTNQIRNNELKQIKKYKNGWLICKDPPGATLDNLKVISVEKFSLTPLSEMKDLLL